MKSAEVKRLAELEVENQRLKELLAEAELDKRMLKVTAEGVERCQVRMARALVGLHKMLA